MALSAIEVLALIFALIGGIKIIVILIQPKSWMNVTKAVYGNKGITTVISLFLAVFFLFILTNAGITIVQIFAVMAFMAPLMALGVTAYSKEMLAMANKLLKSKDVIRKAWIAFVIWIILIIWVLFSIIS